MGDKSCKTCGTDCPAAGTVLPMNACEEYTEKKEKEDVPSGIECDKKG